MIYTSYDMIQDCRADKPEGWSYFITNYVPVIRKLLAHYGSAGDLERILVALRRADSSLFSSMEPAPERWFVTELRQKVLAELPSPPPDIELDLETVASAFEPLTLSEKQVAWLEAMGYDAAAIGAMMRMAPKTVEKIETKAADLLRGKSDTWRRSILRENARLLGQAAAASGTKDCLPLRVFLDILDGRTTWRGRETMEQHVTQCWHCIDQYSRLVEVLELIRGIQPLTLPEASEYQTLLGIRSSKPSLWRRLAGK